MDAARVVSLQSACVFVQRPYFVDPGMLYVQEHSAPPTMVATLATVDLDDGQTLTCMKISGDPAFVLYPNCSVLAIVTLDGYLGDRVRTMTVLVGDNGSPPLNSTLLRLNITILVFNNAPVATSGTVLTLADTTPVGLGVYTATYTDREGDTSLFSISGGNRCRFDVFTIDSDTGVLSVKDRRALNVKYCTVMKPVIRVTNVPRPDDPRDPPFVDHELSITITDGVRSVT